MAEPIWTAAVGWAYCRGPGRTNAFSWELDRHLKGKDRPNCWTVAEFSRYIRLLTNSVNTEKKNHFRGCQCILSPINVIAVYSVILMRKVIFHFKEQNRKVSRETILIVNIFFSFWLCWVSFSSCDERGLLFLAARAAHCWGFSLPSAGYQCTTSFVSYTGLVVGAPRLQSRGVAVVVRELGCSMACGISPDQGSSPWPLHWQVDSYTVYHWRSPRKNFWSYKGT